MKNIILSTILALTVTTSAQAFQATSNTVAATSMVTSGWAYAGLLYTEVAVTLGVQLTFVPTASTLQVTARAINGLNREEVERAIEREDQDTLDSIRDLIRYELEEAGEISSGDELSNDEADILLYVVLTK
ncbi:hypothetical protein [Halobacteriovorax sp. ZH5_bin.2]|uniref:hypothetical protein n=1 Tax=unclassified Halobacteriovorax TaxID=2639665 RepID=UPI00371A0548